MWWMAKVASGQGAATKTDRRLSRGESLARKPYGIIATECLYFNQLLPAREIREGQESQQSAWTDSTLSFASPEVATCLWAAGGK